jgi:uncharacterized membrane protein
VQSIFVIGLIIDFIWLGLIAKGFYSKELGSLMRERPNFFAAFLVYVILSMGLVFFTLNNNYASSYLSFALIGAAFGFIFYAVYDLTNFATLDGFKLKVVLVDIIWGTTLGAILGTATKYLTTV